MYLYTPIRLHGVDFTDNYKLRKLILLLAPKCYWVTPLALKHAVRNLRMFVCLMFLIARN